VFGYEGKTAQEKREGAVWGAALSAAFPLGAAAIGKAWNGATSNKVAQELGSGKDFVNLSFTETKSGGGFAAGLYRHVIGKAFGAKGMIESQVNTLTGRIPKRREDMQRGLETSIRDAKTALSNLKFVNSKNEELHQEGAKRFSKNLEEKATAGFRISEDNIEKAYKDKINDLNAASGKTKSDTKHSALLAADEAVNGLNADFRATSILSALPREADEAAELITSMAPQESLRYLDEVWEKFGFASAKKHSYEVDVDDLLNRIDVLAQKEPAVKAGLARNRTGVQGIKDTVKETMALKMDRGLIKGTDLVELRSTIGRYINGLSEGAPEVKDFSNAVQSRIDDIIASQLPATAAESFKADRATWAIKKLVDDTSELATGGKGLREGAYTAEDWLAASKKRNAYITTRGKSILQEEAQEVAEISRARDKAIMKQADEDITVAKQELAKKTDGLKTDRKAEKRSLKDAYSAEIAEINDAFAKSKKDAAAFSARNVKRMETTQRFKQQMAGLDDQIKKLEADEKLLGSLGARSNVSIFEQAWASGVIGTMIKGVLNTGSALALGITGAPALATQSAQRALAGQTARQRSAFAAGQQIGRGVDAVNRSGAVPSLFGAQFQNVMSRDQ
jgi:hypothetical protein